VARIRTIKPDFWTDGNMVKLSPFARLLYIGMWNFTMCDHGHLADDAMKLKLQVLPMDNVDIEALLDEIMASGRVVRMEADGRSYLLVKRFEDHQKIDPRWKTRCPACAQVDSLIPAETQVSLGELTVTPELSPTLPLGREGMGRESKKTPSSKPAASTDFDTFWAEYPRKVGKIAGKKAFDKAIKLTTLEQLLQGVELLKRETAGKELEFIPHPASWLTAGRWDDEPSTKPAANSPWSKDFHK
jgi:hypothetical protein